ncbi:Laminin subunit alpha-1 [Dissostichus eleginoides]|uniref:Laminin subunit alpha-1 n=1 Tax=Dissostichus eleginoides TaxID=100907 RepID=A0AAD9BKN3_DISEL|nr:Laminin subunit alpha-1 [Dissostichus eleginoides]
MALEVHDGKVSLLWDVGSGSSRLEFPAEISNNRWTRVNVTRAAILSFQGCVGEASLNERNIGLWNYERREGECGGCFSSPQTEETSFHFDGSGFSLVQKSLRATSTSIVLLFKTLSPGGLLLYLASNNTRDFLSMELVGGRVRLTFDLGSGALILTSNRKYNSGVWYKITLQRSKRKGYLSIMAADQSSEKEVLEAESPGTASDLNRSDLDPIYIGGLPASRPIRRQVVSRSYVGCIKNAVRSVSLLYGGFVQIAPPSLGQEAELLFSFSSNNQSGVLLAAFSDDKSQRQHFLSVHLLSGALEAELGEVGGASQRVMVVRPDGGTFGDGTKHSVILIINRKYVDEEHLKSVSLLPGGFPRWSPASFFIGGLPSGEESRLPIRVQGLSRRFRGCIQHLVVGGALVDLSGALKYEGAELDSCLLEKVEVAVLPDDQEVEPTPDPAHLPGAPPTHLSAFTPGALTCVLEAEPAVLPSAIQFGSSKHSHMTFSISPSSIRKSVSLMLSLRSRALVGQLVLLSDAKQMDFIVLRMTGGRLVLSADLGRGPPPAPPPAPLMMGSGTRKPAGRGGQTLPGRPPHTHSTRRINASSSFSGCVRSVSLNGAMLDLSSPASQHDVTSCFTNDQTGSYFNGSGYAALMRDGYKVGSDVSVAFEFRTSQSEAVLLGISSAKVDAIGLELIHGQVVFNVNNGAGRVSVRSIGPLLCDGLWHHLVAKKTKHSLSLSVDGRSYSTPNPYPQSTSAETNNPVYLGGFPGCLRKLHLIKSHLNDALELSSAHFLLGVTPNSCPVAKQHVAQL